MNVKFYSLLLSATIMLMLSCSTAKQPLTYFEDIKDVKSGVLGESDYSIKITPEDELLITVNSMIPEATAGFNIPLANPGFVAEMPNQSQPQIQTYVVDKNGDIQFPILGKLHVKGMTIEGLRDMLTAKISEQVENPFVRVELLNFKVNVIGEVKQPTAINVKSNRFSIFDALAAAGDLTEYGLRENVIVIREIDGEKHFCRLNLNDSNITSSPYYYLQQNDVVYVEPNKIKKSNSKYNQNNSFKLSVVSTIVSAASVIASLIIALTVK